MIGQSVLKRLSIEVCTEFRRCSLASLSYLKVRRPNETCLMFFSHSKYELHTLPGESEEMRKLEAD